jgi:hypothetical protein
MTVYDSYDSEEVSSGLRERNNDSPADAWEGWMFGKCKITKSLLHCGTGLTAVLPEIDYHSVLWDEHPLHVIFEDEVW